MSRTIRPLAAALTTVVAGSFLVVGPSPASGRDPQDKPAEPAAAAAAGEVHRVTLITGDVVTLAEDGSGPGTAEVERAPGNTGGYQIEVVGEDLHVVPDQALPFLASGRLDADLFNVTALVEQGYDDASVDQIPLIVEYAPAVRKIPAAPTSAERGAVLESINGAAVAAEKDRAKRFWNAVTPASQEPGTRGRFDLGIAKIHLDEKVQASLADSVAQVGAPQAWAAGYDGTGATVAVLDTGVDQTHPDLAEQITATQSFVPGEDVGDVRGHGTHVASTVLGTGAASGGLEKGVAPGADLIVGKVLDNNGSGAASWIIDGMEWASTRADVVNMSLGSPEASDGTDPMAAAVNQLSESTGVLFVIAAGNFGRVSGIGSPGAAQAALTVGAVDANDERAPFQDMGPRLGDGGLKPELTAPGVDILAARSAQSPGEGSYVSMTGTSMATPHVAGAAAILAAKNPEWTGAQIKDALVSSAKALPGNTAYQVGTGRLDVSAAASGTVTATGTLSFGLFTYPHGDDAPASRSITYTNRGDAPVTLDLTAQVTDDTLTPAPAGMLTLSSNQVTVPAGGSTDVTVTADVNLGAADTTYSGVISADHAGEEVARTAVGLVKEPERYDLSISAVDRQGAPAGGYVTFYRYGSGYVERLAIDPATGTVPTQRLQPGVYNVTSWLPVSGEGGRDSSGVALVGNPHVVIEKNTEVLLDARTANRISVRTPKVSEDTYRRIGYFYDSKLDMDYRAFANAYFADGNVDDLYANPIESVPGSLDFMTRWRRTAPLLELTAIGGGRDLLTPLYQNSSRRWNGTDTVPAVYAGKGTAAEYDGVNAQGKIVLVTRTNLAPWGQTETERAKAAVAAGARMLVVVNDAPGKLFEYAGGTDLPVVALTRAEGQPLIDRLTRDRSVTFRIKGTEFPPYLYDLVKSYQGKIPSNLRYVPQESDLATVHNRFVGAKKELAFEYRADCRAWHSPPCIVVSEPVQTGSTRVDYVSTEDSGDWFEGAFHPAGWDLRGERLDYDPGQTRTNTWFDTVVRGRTGSGFWTPFRWGNFFQVNVPEASSGDEGVTGAMIDDSTSTVTTRLFADGELVDELPFQAVQREVPMTDGWTDYRFEMDNTRSPEFWTHSLRSRSVWNFRAETTPLEEEVGLPLLQLDYHVATDLRGSLRKGSRQQLGLSAFHIDGVAGAGEVAGGTLQISYDDGDTWRRVALRPAGDGSWTGTVTMPTKGASFLSLRASAWDDKGNEVEQEVIRAASVR